MIVALCNETGQMALQLTSQMQDWPYSLGIIYKGES